MNVLHAVCVRADADTLSWLLNVCLSEEDALKLLNQKANKENETPLMIASKLGSVECVRQILEYMKNINKITPEFINTQNADGNTCLHLAAANKPLITYF
jgi:chemotaxis response regulator CheB